MSNGWVDGVISSLNEVKSGVQYFVSTTYGIAVMYSRVHESIQGLKVGSYVRVIMEPSADPSKSEEVQYVEWNKRPNDHEVDVKWNKITIKCNAYFVGQENGWFILQNEYLGLLGMKALGGIHERTVRIGCLYRVVIHRSKPEDGVSSICDPIGWIVDDINFADREIHTGSWFEGVVTKADDTYIIATSSELPADAFIFEWQNGKSRKREEILGRWIRFKVDIRRANDHGLRYRSHNFTEINSLYKTRVIKGLPEFLIRCRWNGEMEDSKALLHSEMGPIRDNDGILDAMCETTKGEYEFWVVKHFRQNHTARWKLSIYDNEPMKKNMDSWRNVSMGEKLNEQSSIEKSFPVRSSIKHKKDGRILDLMLHFMKFKSVQDTLMENDKESAAEIKVILDRYAVRKERE